jgi:aspartate/methionine/tyrosine aminotransferase
MAIDLASRVGKIAPFYVMELINKAQALEKEGHHLIHMGVGEPDFTAPPAVVAAANAAMTAGKTQYTSAVGLLALREAIARHYAQVYGVQVDPARIVVTAGASAALMFACAALVEKGSEVLLPDPSYPCNSNFVAAFEGCAKLIPSGPENRYQLTAEMVQAHWSEHTRGVLLASPSNPTGTSIAPAALSRILDVVADKGGFAIVDEIYLGLSYEGQATTALSLSDDVIVINSFSKYFNMTGWRLGWLVLPERLVPAIEKLAQNLLICPPSLSQHAAIACFEADSIALYEARKAEFKRRRDYLVPALQALGFKIPVMPDGAFYVYADCTALTDNAEQFCLDLLYKAGVVITPGLDFGPYTAMTHVRFSYANSLENLQEAIRRIAAFIHSS